MTVTAGITTDRTVVTASYRRTIDRRLAAIRAVSVGNSAVGKTATHHGALQYTIISQANTEVKTERENQKAPIAISGHHSRRKGNLLMREVYIFFLLTLVTWDGIVST